MRRARVYWLALPLALGLLLGLALAAQAKTGEYYGQVEQEFEAAEGFEGIEGEVRHSDRGGEAELRVEIEGAQELAGETLEVYVGDDLVGEFEVTQFGTGKLSLNTRTGDDIPEVTGETVEVRTGDDEVVVFTVFKEAVYDHGKVQIAVTGATGFEDVKGKARYEEKGEELRLRVEIENAKTLVGQTLDIFVGGSLVGSATVDIGGNARLALNSDLGDTVPAQADISGHTLEVKSGTVLVASGTFPTF